MGPKKTVPAPAPAPKPASAPTPAPAPARSLLFGSGDQANVPAKAPVVAPAPSSELCIKRNNIGNFDLSSVFHVQKDYITDVTTDNANNAPEIVEFVNNVQNKLQSLSSQFKTANTSSQSVLAHQQDMLDIVNAEKLRLEQKKQLVDSADLQQKHVMLLNDTHRKKYAEYTKIVIVFVIGIFLYVMIRMLSDFLQIPEVVYIFFHIINVLVCSIAITTIYATIESRSNIDFDKIVIPPPNTGPASSSSSSKKAQDLFGSFCLGEQCCDTNNGVVWNDTLEMCVAKGQEAESGPAPADNFLTYSQYLSFDESASSKQPLENVMLPKLVSSSDHKSMSYDPFEIYGKV